MLQTAVMYACEILVLTTGGEFRENVGVGAAWRPLLGHVRQEPYFSCANVLNLKCSARK